MNWERWACWVPWVVGSVIGFVAILAVSVWALAAGGEVSSPTVRSMIGLGVFGGLVLAETRRPGGGWRHQKRTALTSRETMRELR